MGLIRLAIDAMGGDYAPAEIVAGALAGARRSGVGLLLAGRPAEIERELERADTGGLAVEVAPADGAIEMGEEPAQAVRSRPEASINVACRCVLEGRAEGVLSMGHSGASMVAALLNFGRIPGVDRPALIVPLLGLREDLFMIDAGVNPDASPTQLLQFARMGAAYVEHAAGIPQPRVALLSNGSEPNKGNAAGRQAYALLSGAGRLNFTGNVEGHGLLSGQVNLVITDGFVGNILLKAAEGIVAALLSQAGEILPQVDGPAAERFDAHLETLRARNHYARHGVSCLLGVRQPMFIGHGRSRAEAVANGIETARRMIAGRVTEKIAQVFLGQNA
jgi:glycerol-3-phosphate acyltransferase PlsX